MESQAVGSQMSPGSQTTLSTVCSSANCAQVQLRTHSVWCARSTCKSKASLSSCLTVNPSVQPGSRSVVSFGRERDSRLPCGAYNVACKAWGQEEQAKVTIQLMNTRHTGSPAFPQTQSVETLPCEHNRNDQKPSRIEPVVTHAKILGPSPSE